MQGTSSAPEPLPEDRGWSSTAGFGEGDIVELEIDGIGVLRNRIGRKGG